MKRIKIKITPTTSVKAGWNGTVKGVIGLAKSIERNKESCTPTK